MTRCLLALALFGACSTTIGPTVPTDAVPAAASPPPSTASGGAPATPAPEVPQPPELPEQSTPEVRQQERTLFDDDGARVWLGTDLRGTPRLYAAWGEHTASVRVSEEAVRAAQPEVRRFSLGPERRALEVRGVGDRPWLFVHDPSFSRGMLTRLVRDESVPSLYASGRARFAPDGLVTVPDDRVEPCRPTRAEVESARREVGPSDASLESIRRRALTWEHERPIEWRLRLEGDALVPGEPRVRTTGGWGPCRGRFPEAETAASLRAEAVSTFDTADAEVVHDEGGVTIRWERTDTERAEIRWGNAVHRVAPTERGGGTREVAVRHVRVAPRTPGLFVTFVWHADEDEEWQHNVLLMRRGDQVHEVTDSPSTDFTRGFDGSASFPGDGTVRIARVATNECAPSPSDVRRMQQLVGEDDSEAVIRAFEFWERSRSVERILEIRGNRFVHATPRFRWTGPWGRCEGRMMAACPFVDVVGVDGSTERIGEILRSAEYAPVEQVLALPHPTEQTVRIRLSEEKDERTFLDAVGLDVGHSVVAPTSCDAADPPAYCAADGRYMVLERGEVLEVEFAVGEAARGVALRAVGYYEPVPAQRTR